MISLLEEFKHGLAEKKHKPLLRPFLFVLLHLGRSPFSQSGQAFFGEVHKECRYSQVH